MLYKIPKSRNDPYAEGRGAAASATSGGMKARVTESKKKTRIFFRENQMKKI